MTERPFVVENLSASTTHAAALTHLLARYPGIPLAVATGYLNLEGLHTLAELTTDGRRGRLLLGAEPHPGLGATLPLDRFSLAVETLAHERNLANFPPSRAARRLARIQSWLAEPQVEVCQYTARFLHGKAYLLGDPRDGEAALVTSANLTGGGLQRNLELGLVDYNPVPANHALEWFEQLWADAADYKQQLRRLLFPDPGLIDPQTVYLRALLELYGDDLDGDPAPAPATVQLAPFQHDGYERARQILQRHHGVVYAEGVGTGKTEVGLAFIEEYALRRGQHALVVVPAQLRQTWQERINQARLPAQVVSYNELARDEQLTADGDVRRVLHNDRDSYRLVIADEAHALRNPDTTWYRAMTRLLGGERKDLVLLTATPVNNGLWDLYHLIMLFARHDRALAAIGIRSIRDVFLRAGASERDPENLDPDVLFPVADATSVRRDRRFIQQQYPSATFPDGTPVRFPRPVLTTRRYDLDTAYPNLVADITGWIGQLTMARYTPSAYELGLSEASADEAALGGLLQSGILKRFESCSVACRRTIDRMITAHHTFLASWHQGWVPSRATLQEATKQELDDAGLATWVSEALADDSEAQSADNYRADYVNDVTHDLQILCAISERLTNLDPASDPMLAHLQQLLAELDDDKVAVFATFGDTIRYLEECLPEVVGGRHRVSVIGGETNPDERTRRLSRFCPDTVVHPGYQPPDGEVDLLLSIDVLAEGQNLQQASCVISFDMPWNPQRVVQRNGRVIRLRSPHEQVNLFTMLPREGELELLLQLEATIRRKIVAANLYGMESAVLEGVEPELRSYAQRLVEEDSTLLDEDDSDDTTSFAGEELRSRLMRTALEGETTRLRNLPWGIGSAFRQGLDIPSRGRPGIFFACRTRTGQRHWRYLQHPTGDDAGSLLTNDINILRRIDPGNAASIPPETLDLALEDAWQQAADDIIREHNQLADPHAEAESIGPTQRFALEILRDPHVYLPEGADHAEQALSVQRGTATRRDLGHIRGLLQQAAITRDEAARRIVDLVVDYGLHPVEPPPAVEPITADDLGVVCWMAVLPDNSAEGTAGIPPATTRTKP
jgi:superfamily II DNA or RNA helicase